MEETRGGRKVRGWGRGSINTNEELRSSCEGSAGSKRSLRGLKNLPKVSKGEGTKESWSQKAERDEGHKRTYVVHL